jgi:hypothetical protein
MYIAQTILFRMKLSAKAMIDRECVFWPDGNTAKSQDKSTNNAALSWRFPIQDAADYWNPQGDRSSPDTVSGGPAPGQVSHNVDT